MTLNPAAIREYAHYRATGSAGGDTSGVFSKAELTAAETEGERLIEVAVQGALGGASRRFDLLPTTGLETSARERYEELRRGERQ